MNNEQKADSGTYSPTFGNNHVMRSCSFCQHYRPEEIGDSDYGAVYSKVLSCSKYFDMDTETEEDIPDFNRNIERSCCQLDFWQVLEVDVVLKNYFDKEMSEKSGENFNNSYEFFKARYNYA